MSHYYLALAVLLVPALLATATSGIWHDGSETHLTLGLFTAIFCVATSTLLILFMIVTGRVLKAAMQARELAAEFLTELNDFFGRKRAYPVALLAAAVAVATAVLGYGRYIGVPSTVHMLCGLLAVGMNLWALNTGIRALRENQRLLDRVARELDRLDAEEEAPAVEDAGVEWAFPAPMRWLIFAACAWLPYLYWGLVVWRGEFRNVGRALPLATAVVSGLGILLAWRNRRLAR